MTRPGSPAHPASTRVRTKFGVCIYSSFCNILTKARCELCWLSPYSTTDHTLLPGSPAVHLVSLCLICGHLWCALSLSSHLVSPCAPAASTGHRSRTFSPHARCQATGLACRRRRCREAASQSPPQVAICISINLKCAI